MEKILIDRTQLKTFKSYAKMTGYSVQRIYQKVKNGELKTVIIDGVKFIKL